MRNGQRKTEWDRNSSWGGEVKPLPSDDLLAFSLPTHFSVGMWWWWNELAQQKVQSVWIPQLRSDQKPSPWPGSPSPVSPIQVPRLREEEGGVLCPVAFSTEVGLAKEEESWGYWKDLVAPLLVLFLMYPSRYASALHIWMLESSRDTGHPLLCCAAAWPPLNGCHVNLRWSPIGYGVRFHFCMVGGLGELVSTERDHFQERKELWGRKWGFERQIWDNWERELNSFNGSAILDSELCWV